MPKKRAKTLYLTEDVIAKVEADGNNDSATVQRILDAYYGMRTDRELVDEMLRTIAARAKARKSQGDELPFCEED